MNFNLPLILLCLVLFTGLIALIDLLFWEPGRKEANIKAPLLIDYARSFFPVLVLVLVIRSFVVQNYEVPSGSLEPTIQPTEFLLVNQFSYGLRLPVSGTKILPIGEPKRGDIVVFKWPVNPQVDFIKRVVGLPGDTISYQNKTLFINGQEMKQVELKPAFDKENGMLVAQTEMYREDFDGHVHLIYRTPGKKDFSFQGLKVPKGEYFVMGDNRDNSEDSRYWGFVPENALEGKAEYILFSLSQDPGKSFWNRIRWGRMFNKII